MSRQKRAYHPAFLAYQKEIVNHPNYRGMPEPFGPGGRIRWVVVGKTPLGVRRKAWWVNVRKTLIQKGDLKDAAHIADAVRAIHPLGEKPCQICGRKLWIDYVYPSRRTFGSLSSLAPGVPTSQLEPVASSLKTLNDYLGSEGFGIAASVFRVPDEIDRTVEAFATFIYSSRQSQLSPGMMSNPPDRFDGLHDYGICCRGTEDTGRHSSNLHRYGEDRRAYEQWADGDWKAASWLMKKFSEYGMTADHIGPISLGFAHRPRFHPLSRSDNAAKNNRMSLADVKSLMRDEARGETVISWHSEALWRNLRARIRTDADGLALSKLMRRHMHYVLSILGALKREGHIEFLRSLLHPEYAYFAIEFDGFDPTDGSFKRMRKIPGTKGQYARNAHRYERIALESLDRYAEKENRNQFDLDVSRIESAVRQVEKALADNGLAAAKAKLKDIYAQLADDAVHEFERGQIPDEDLSALEK